MFMTNANCFALRTTSATRSVPLWCLGEVKATSAPQSKAASAMRMSSVAMITESRFFACRHRFQTRCRRGLPAIRCSGFPWKTCRTPSSWNNAHGLIHAEGPIKQPLHMSSRARRRRRTSQLLRDHASGHLRAMSEGVGFLASLGMTVQSWRCI